MSIFHILQLKNIQSLLKYSGFKINNISKNEYHGGSLRTIAVNSKATLKQFDTKKLIQYENKNKIYTVNFYRKMMKKIIKKNLLIDKLIKYTLSGYTLCGVGAAAKSNTFLTFYGLNNNLIKFLTDTSKFKQNKYTPFTRIIIKDDKEIAKYKKIVCLILSWNISDIVINKIKKINKNIKIIKT